MSPRKKIWLIFGLILVLSVLAGLIDYPKGPDVKIGNYFKEIKIHLGLDLQGGTHLVYQADTSDIPSEEKGEAVEGVRDVIERRINAFGVSEPLIQTNRIGEEWRVIVELAGIKDINQAINMIGQTPVLDFREEGEAPEQSEEEKAALEAFNAEQKTKAEEVLALVQAEGADFVALANEYSEDPGNQTSETGDLRGGDLGFFGRGVMVTEFETAVFDQLEVDQISSELVETQFGYHIIKKTGLRTNDEGVEEASASHILFQKQSSDLDNLINPLANMQLTELSGKHLERAQVVFDPNTQEPQVSLKFNEEGKDLFGQITERNVDKIVGIYLDGSPISLPRVNEAISSGEAVISGDFTVEEAKETTRRLNAGALPVPIELINQQTIGASLGEVSIQKSLLAGAIGLALVALFMIFYYRLPGLLAVSSLVVYALVVIAVFKLLPVTLTLAGVAGFIMSIGMAVDANVLIFERTKEELRDGKTLNQAIEEGFNRAWLSIRDGNFSTLITCVILFWFGTSIIKGFALTLGIGVLISMFSAIVITRTFLRLVVTRKMENKLWLFGVKNNK